MNEPLSILVFGAGAIGTYTGGSLALAGNRVTFLEQPQAVEVLRRRGLRLDLGNDERNRGNEPAVVKPEVITCAASLVEAFQQGPFDFAIFALKSFDTAAAVEAMKPFVGQMPPIVCFSNGVDNEPELATLLGEERVIAGTITSSIGRNGVGDIVLERKRGTGVGDGHPLSLLVQQALNKAGLIASLFQHPAEMKWTKLLTNLPANATAAILNLNAAEVYSHPGLFRLEVKMLREALRVMQAQRLRVVDLPGTPAKLLALGIHLPAFISQPVLAKTVGGGRGGKLPSLHIDLHSGRGKSEVGWLNGAVVRHGEKSGVPTPVNMFLTETLVSMTRGEIPIETYAHQPEKLLNEVKQRLEEKIPS